MNNVEVNFHGNAMGNQSYALAWIEDDYRYHVWMTEEGEPGEHIYKNHVDPEQAKRERTTRLFVANKVNQKRIEKALGKLGVPLRVAMDEAERAYSRREERREADIKLGEVVRARTAFAKALEAYPDLMEAFDRMQDDELLAVTRTLWRNF